MNKRILLVVGIPIILAGCGSAISQEDYNAKITKSESLQRDYDAKEAELEAVQKELDELKTQNMKESVSGTLSGYSVPFIEISQKERSEIPDAQNYTLTIAQALETIGVTDINDIQFGNYEYSENPDENTSTYCLDAKFKTEDNTELISRSVYVSVNNNPNKWNLFFIIDFKTGHYYYTAKENKKYVDLYNYKTHKLISKKSKDSDREDSLYNFIKNIQNEYIKSKNISTPIEPPESTAVPSGNFIPLENIHFMTKFHGRGISDSGREEPQYEGRYGYVSSSMSDIEELHSSYVQIPWTIPTYGKIDADHFEQTGTIEHKTIVKVISQDLEHEGYGSYSGYLTVSIPNTDSTEYIINVRHFITNSYWNFESALQAEKYGPCIAQYTQNSEYRPVYRNNEIADIPEGTNFLVYGKTGTYGRGYVDDEFRQIEARYYKEGADDYSTIYFNEHDLKLIY